MSVFSNINISTGVTINTVGDLNALKSYRPTRLRDGDTVIVTGLNEIDGQGAVYGWEETSAAIPNNYDVIRPNMAVGKGRWLRLFGTGATGPTGPVSTVPGPQGGKGDPGGNVSDVGTFAQAKALTIAVSNPATTTIRLSDRGKATFERDTNAFGDLLTKYPDGENIWWFRDAANTRWILAGDRVSIQHAGAVPGKTGDNTNIIQKALDFGSVSSRVVYVPSGTWTYAGTLIVRNKTGLTGEPGLSILYCTTRVSGAIILEGNGPTLYGITRLHYLPRPVGLNDRVGDDAADGIYCRGATNFTIQFCRTEGPQAASLMIRGCQYGRITNNWFESSLADSIHITAAAVGDAPIYNADGSFKEINRIPIPCYRLHIGDNIVNNSGDDNIAVVSYASHARAEPTSNAVIKYPGYFTEYTESGGTRILQANNRSINIVGNSTYGGDARGITVVGGRDVNITGNYIEDPVVAGILAYGEESYDTYGCENVNITGNTLVNTGNGGDYKPLRYDAYGNQMLNRSGVLGVTRNADGVNNASVIISGRSASFPSSNISFRNNMLIGMRQRGVSIDAFATNVDVVGNSFRNAIGVAVFANAGSNLCIQNNRIIDASNAAIGVNIYNCAGHIVVQGNQLHNINTSGSTGTDAIHFEGQPAAGVISTTISDNRISGPQTYERFVEAFFDNVIAENNIGSGDVGLGGNPNTVKQRVKLPVTQTVSTNVGNAGTAPTALSDTVSRTDYNALVTHVNTIKTAYNDLVAKIYAAGLGK